MAARLDAAAVSLMDGALHCSASGVASSLLPANLKAAAAVENADEATRLKTWPLLFDPQTSGGLLAGCVLCVLRALMSVLYTCCTGGLRSLLWSS